MKVLQSYYMFMRYISHLVQQCSIRILTSLGIGEKPQFAGPITLPETIDNNSLFNTTTISVLIIILIPITYLISHKVNKTFYSPQNVALRSLKLLKKKFLDGRIAKQETLTELGHILNIYLSFLLQIDTTSMSNEELFPFLINRAEQVDATQRESIIKLLKDLEVVIFAELTVDRESIVETFDLTSTFIRKCSRS